MDIGYREGQTRRETCRQKERQTEKETDRQRDKVTARLAHGPLVTPTGCGNIQMVNRAKHFTAITISFSLTSTLSLSLMLASIYLSHLTNINIEFIN